MKNQKRSYKNYLIPVVLISLILIVFVSATTIINNNNNQISKTLINDSGMYYNDGSTYRGVSSGTADVVVCRGTNAFDDVYKSVKWVSGCDGAYLCKSTDIDCSNEIGSATDSIYTNGGGTIFFKSGVYPINSYILRSNYVNNGIRFIGSGIGSTIFNITDNSNMFDLRNVKNFEFAYFTVLNAFPATNTSGKFLTFGGSTASNNINFHDLELYNQNGAITANSPCNNCRIANSRIYGTQEFSTFAGITFYASNYVTIENNRFDNFSYSAINFQPATPSKYIWIKNNIVNNVGMTQGNGLSYGIYLNVVDHAFIINNLVTNINLSAIYVFSNSKNTLVEGNYVNNSGLGIDIDANNNNSMIRVIGNEVDNSQGTGIWVGDSDNTVVIGNTIRNSNVINIGGTGRDGIHLGGAVRTQWNQITGNIIVDDRSTPQQDFCVSEWLGGANNTISNNVCNGYLKNMTDIDAYGNTYADNYYYPSPRTNPCALNSVFNGKTISNSTTSCLCNLGAWKCWNFL